MAWTSSLNCLFLQKSLPNPSFTELPRPFSLKNPWFFPGVCLTPLVPNPLVAERASWRSSQSCVIGGQQPIGNPYRFLSHFFCIPGNPCATRRVTRGEGSFSYQGVSTREVRHAPVSAEKLGSCLPLRGVSERVSRGHPAPESKKCPKQSRERA